MKLFEVVYVEACSSWTRGIRGLRVSEYDKSGLDNGTFIAICRIVSVRNDFSCTGICPLNRNFVRDTDFIPSQ
jgi:hypothetical protein